MRSAAARSPKKGERVTGAGGVRLATQVRRRLSDGPSHTLDLARGPMGLSGPDGPLSAAVFALLGDDPRFCVDGEGCWSLSPVFDGNGGTLNDVSFAVVDVETTGGSYSQGHRVTEIAVVELRGGKIVDEYSTLVNPGRYIPSFIQKLTSITDEMVCSAPYFDEIADEVHRRLEGRVFVAHNAAFDWGFVASQLAEATGEVPDTPRLCTVRLTRRFVPELRRRNLDAVTAYFGVDIHGRHRATGDAIATARVLHRILDRAEGEGIATLDALNPTRDAPVTPPDPGSRR